MSEPGSMDYLRRTPGFARVIWIAVAVLAVVGGLVGMNAGLSRFDLSVPRVERQSVVIDTVRRGPMVHEVRGIGTLVAEVVMWVPAMTDGRVAAIPALPGVTVQSETVVVELRNPDLQLALSEAESKLESSRADLISKQADLQNQLLTLEAELVALNTEHELAQAQHEVTQSLFAKGVTTAHELKLDKHRAEGLSKRLEVEQRRFDQFRESIPSQTATFVASVSQAEAALKLQLRKVDGLKVVAGIDGVLEQVPVEVGQQVTAGEKLARVVDPRKLKATLKIPEVESRYVKLGQAARVDTHHGLVVGTVVRIDPGVAQGTVAVDIEFTEPLPEEARPELSVVGTIEIRRVEDTLSIGKPVSAAAESTVSLFKVNEKGDYAVRVPAHAGIASVSHLEITGGLAENDQVILTDMTRYDSVDRIQLK